MATSFEKNCEEGDGHYHMQQLCHSCQQNHVMFFYVSIGRELSLLTFATEFTVRKCLPTWILLKIIISASLSLG